MRLLSVALLRMQIMRQHEGCLHNILYDLPHQRIRACPLDLQTCPYTHVKQVGSPHRGHTENLRAESRLTSPKLGALTVKPASLSSSCIRQVT